jgi:hypothetical protein
MRKFFGLAMGVILSLSVVYLTDAARAQQPGSTVQGDILRGQGRFLEGAGWYQLNSARARNIDVDTWKKHNLEVQRLYRAYLQERYLHIQYKKGISKKSQDELKKKFEEEQRRWRENPTPEDISSGNALNALAGDLADPSIAPTVWQYARVELPPGLELTTLAFKIADSRVSKASQSTVAIDRMKVSDGWPLWLRRPELKAEQAAYERAVATAIGKCQKGTPLEATDYDRLRETVVALQKKVPEVVPARDNQRAQAIAFVNQLDDATRIFAEQTYAERLIKDVAEHKAATVAELLGFMRYHYLLFSDPGRSPELARMYEGLYQLLRQQKDKLGQAGVAMAPGDAGGLNGGKVADQVAVKLGQVKTTLEKVRFPQEAQKKRSLKSDAVSQLDGAMDDLAKGLIPRERLEKVHREIQVLKAINASSQDHSRLLGEAMALLEVAFADLRLSPPEPVRRGQGPGMSKKAQGRGAATKKRG